MTTLSIDDFEWVEAGFDQHFLKHKKFEYTVASVTNFSGWAVRVVGTGHGAVSEHGLDLDAAKLVAIIYATQNMEKYDGQLNRMSGTKHLTVRKRPAEFTPETFSKGVFKMD